MRASIFLPAFLCKLAAVLETMQFTIWMRLNSHACTDASRTIWDAFDMYTNRNYDAWADMHFCTPALRLWIIVPQMSRCNMLTKNNQTLRNYIEQSLTALKFPVWCNCINSTWLWALHVDVCYLCRLRKSDCASWRVNNRLKFMRKNAIGNFSYLCFLSTFMRHFEFFFPEGFLQIGRASCRERV